MHPYTNIVVLSISTRKGLAVSASNRTLAVLLIYMIGIVYLYTKNNQLMNCKKNSIVRIELFDYFPHISEVQKQQI
jgi:hypothetical protein